MAEFFVNNFIAVYFFYGLSFFAMGLAIFVEIGHTSALDFSQALRPLAGFGLIHGSHEWFEMFLLINPELAAPPHTPWIATARLLLLASSFLMLIAFGARLISGPLRLHVRIWIYGSITVIWVVGLAWVIATQPAGPERVVAADVYTRYALAIPGAALAVVGLLMQRKVFLEAGMPSFARDMAIAALAFGLYGGIGQLFSAPSIVFPSEYLNSAAFLRWFGFPVQVLRAAMAALAAVAIIHSLRVFEIENQSQMTALQDAQRREQQHNEQMRAEMLHRTVKAQESERQRIALELHDGIGQTLTALGMGLRGLSSTIPINTGRAVQQSEHLEKLARSGLDELQRMVTGLHPPQIDDLGLQAALRWYAGEVGRNYGLSVRVNGPSTAMDLSREASIVLFRIAQEAITNTIRHARAKQVLMHLDTTPEQVLLTISDDGKGFDVEKALQSSVDEPCWGLLGMIERAALVGGTCQIQSWPDLGTRIHVSVPIQNGSKEEKK